MSDFPRKGPIVKQINNLVIRDCPDATPERRFQVWTKEVPPTRLEEFSTQSAAEDWCRRTTDFLMRERLAAEDHEGDHEGECENCVHLTCEETDEPCYSCVNNAFVGGGEGRNYQPNPGGPRCLHQHPKE